MYQAPRPRCRTHASAGAVPRILSPADERLRSPRTLRCARGPLVSGFTWDSYAPWRHPTSSMEAFMTEEHGTPAVRHRVVIAGGGFGGLYAALELEKTLARDADVEITLINKDNFF